MGGCRLPPTATRVNENTCEETNRRIRERMEAHVAWMAGRLDEIEKRIDELDREWDIERVLEVGVVGATAITALLARHTRVLRVMPFMVLGFFALHALQGWCPPVPLLRALGFRTPREIEHERYALKALRGDFKSLDTDESQSCEARAQQAIAAAEPVRP